MRRELLEHRSVRRLRITYVNRNLCRSAVKSIMHCCGVLTVTALWADPRVAFTMALDQFLPYGSKAVPGSGHLQKLLALVSRRHLPREPSAFLSVLSVLQGCFHNETHLRLGLGNSAARSDGNKLHSTRAVSCRRTARKMGVFWLTGC